MNKKTFKEMYSKKINKEENFQNIINRLDNKKDFKFLKFTLVPVCLVLAISCVMILKNDNLFLKENDVPTTEDLKYVINFNKVEAKKETLKLNGRIDVIIDETKILDFNVLANLDFPKDLKEENYAVYFRSNPKNGEYDKLGHYIKRFSKGDKNIDISYSEDNFPVRDYYFEDGQISIIDSFHFTIYQYEEVMMTRFKYNDLFIDIETNNITHEEFVNLVKSILE